MKHTACFAALVGATLAVACDPGLPDRPTQGVRQNTAARMGERTASADLAPWPPLAAQPELGDVLALMRGVYVKAGTRCDSPPNSAILIYDGRGIGDVAARACHTVPLEPMGNKLQIDQSCVDTGSGAIITERQVFELQGRTAFSLKTPRDFGVYRLCRGLDPASFQADG